MLEMFPRAVLHVDADAFFASVEQAVHPELRGRPVVTGRERGIIACASYEAKALGIARGLPLHEARRRCQDLVVLPSDYETYSLFSRRLFDLLRHYTPTVEEYSIDEAFADLSGLRRLHRASYPEIARRIQADVRAALGISVSVGLSLSKGLAKLASKFRKPAGFTAVGGRHIHLLLARTPLDKVWGFGPNTVHLLAHHGLRTALEFARRPEAWARGLLGKTGAELWRELRGDAVHPVHADAPPAPASISKCKTFPAPSADRLFVYGMLIRNLESAFAKLRRHRLTARGLTAILRRRDFSQAGIAAELNRPTASAQEAAPLAAAIFDRLFAANTEYRTATVILDGLASDAREQPDLFEDRLRIDKLARAARALDNVNARFGKHSLGLAPTLFLARGPRTERCLPPVRRTALLPGETARRRLVIPRLFLPV